MQATLAALLASCTTATIEGWHHMGAGWAAQPIGMGGGYTHALPPNRPSCFYNGDGGNPSGVTYRNLFGPTSRHPGGANVGMLDGSVKFIKDSVNLGAWGALGTRAGGEVIDASNL